MLVMQPTENYQGKPILSLAAQDGPRVIRVDQLQLAHHRLRLSKHVLEGVRKIINKVFQIPSHLPAEALAHAFDCTSVSTQFLGNLCAAEKPLKRDKLVQQVLIGGLEVTMH